MAKPRRDKFGCRYFGLNDGLANYDGKLRQGDFVDENSLYVSSTHWSETGARIVVEQTFQTIKEDVRLNLKRVAVD